jgi:hypothetical protein
MSVSAKTKRNRDASKSQGKAKKPKQPQPGKDQTLDSEAIRRAVDDGMQDLRTKKPAKR